MSSNIVQTSSFNSKNIKITEQKKFGEKGGKQSYLNYNNNRLVMQTATMTVPFGLNVYENNGVNEYSVSLSFREMDQNPKIKEFMDVISQIDEKLLQEGHKNSKAWFKSDLSPDVIKAFYTPSLKYGKDKDGNVTSYPPTIKLKLRKFDGAFETKFYDMDGNPYKDIPIEDLLVKGVQITAIMECTGVWFVGSKFGLTWRAKQIAIHKLPEKLSDFAFKDLSKSLDDDAFRSSSTSSVIASVMSQVMPQQVQQVQQVQQEKEDEKEDEKEEKEVDDGDDIEPMNIPKKVVKKTIVKKK